MDVPAASVEVAILAVNSARAATACLRRCGRRGRLVIFSALASTALPGLHAVHLRELEIVGSCNDEDRLDEAMKCLGDPAMAMHEIITHHIPFERLGRSVHFGAGRARPRTQDRVNISGGRMKITDVEAFILESPYENRAPEGSDEAHGVKHCLLLKVSTDEGLVGWSDVETAPHVAAAALSARRRAGRA